MTTASPRIHVLVIEDHPMVRRTFCDLISSDPDIQIVGVADDGPEALIAGQRLAPDVVLLDVSLPSLSGIEVARKLRHSLQPGRIIMLVEFNVASVTQIMDRHGYSYVLKGNPSELTQAIHAVYRGERWLSR